MTAKRFKKLLMGSGRGYTRNIAQNRVDYIKYIHRFVEAAHRVNHPRIRPDNPPGYAEYWDDFLDGTFF